MFPRAACLLAFLLLLPVAFADELDDLLAQPAPAHPSADTARARIDTLRAQEASHPDRAEEIEAWLIPLLRVAEPAKPAPSATPAGPAPESRPLFVIEDSDGVVTVIRATSFQKQDHALIVLGANGSRAIVQPGSVLAQLRWYSDEALESGAVPLEPLALSYELTLRRMPASQRGTLAPMLEKIRALQKKRADEVAAGRADARRRVDEATSPVYRVDSGYTREALARMLLAAEKARRESPWAAARIDAWAKPFRAHFENLLAGRRYIRGEWLDQAEIDRRALDARKAEFARGLDMTLDATALPPGAIRGAVLPPILVALALMIAGGTGFAFFRERVALRAASIALLAVTPAGLAALFFLATRTPEFVPPPLPGETPEEPAIAALAQAANIAPSAPASVPDEAINAFFRRHVTFDAKGESDGVRRAMAVRAAPGKLLVFEAVRAAGLEWIVRYDVAFRQGGLAVTRVWIGRLPCPPSLARPLWRSLEAQLSGWLADTHLLEHLAPQPPIDHAIPFAPRAAAPSP
jgi:hypothetical protein